ncbi:MAG TPA: ABC transporter ATP-binding protein [Microthrixaceae bacterium]|nr:ABC transporter ATP-binding protein [Microthrixaceae bacterium]
MTLTTEFTPPVTTSQQPSVRVDDVSKFFGRGEQGVLALDRISLQARPGEFVCLVGASGCGKSTLLNLVADLDRPSTGTVSTDGRVTLLFQESALFPWLTVEGNINLALKLRGVPRRERPAQTAELLRSVRLDEFGKRLPHELSGGMRQRVAIARAFAQDVEILLMDEPFGALDAMTRDLLHDELERLWQTRSLTVVFVTHNVREAVRLGDRVVLLSSRPGRVVEEFEVDIARPRRIDSTEVTTLAAHITDRLREEVRRHAVQAH